jgi:hypothetical protein
MQNLYVSIANQIEVLQRSRNASENKACSNFASQIILDSIQSLAVSNLNGPERYWKVIPQAYTGLIIMVVFWKNLRTDVPASYGMPLDVNTPSCFLD